MAVTDVAIEKIKDMIISGRLRPGDRLPPEKELSEELGLSRNSLREAVKALEVVRVLDVRRGDGTYVTSLEPHLLLDALGFMAELQQDDSVIQAFEVRRMLEPPAAAAATHVLGPDQIEHLQELVDAAATAADVTALVENDLAFHRALTAGAGNNYLTSLVDSLSGATVRARIWRGISEEGAVERTIAEHQAIVNAIRERDGELVSALLVAHIGGVQRWLSLRAQESNEREEDSWNE